MPASGKPLLILETPATDTPPAKRLIRISEVFGDFAEEMIAASGGKVLRKLGTEYYLIDAPVAGLSWLVRWNLPVDHAWPCNPEKMEGFVEKAAQTIFRKFASQNPQAIFIGQLDPSSGHRYYKTLASNLRGRTLQLFPQKVASFRDVEAQDPSRGTLFCMVGKEGLFCGMSTPRAAN